MIIPFARRRLVIGVALAAAIAGTFVALHYHRLGLTLSHYDARGHLIVARRIADSITPGWQQIGAVWLPLPHLLNAIPVQLDFFYRTGASGVAISIASFAIASGAIAWIVLSVTGSTLAAIAGASVFILNPNVLYLQSTPMTEPLLIALTTTAAAMLMSAATVSFGNREDYGTQRSQRPQRNIGEDPSAASAASAASAFPTDALLPGIVCALACLTRYEAWPVIVSALVFLIVARWLSGDPPSEAVRFAARIAAFPAVAIVGFAIFSRVVIGEWFVASGFFVPENKALGDLWMTIKEIAWGAEMLSSAPLVWLGSAGIAALAIVSLVDRRRAYAIVPIALAATAAIPLAAFYRGHPYRIRYMVPLIAIEAIGCGALAALARRARLPVAVAVLALAVATLRPLNATAPMVLEAQWDRPNAPVRAQVTACLGTLKPGAKIMASMGSLGHYMQEASAAGFALRDFLHEGNGDIWLAAIVGPRPFADWILIEEKAEGGDMLAHIAREHPSFLEGYTRVCDGAGVVLYRRD